ncbi:hypothetical protein V495_05563 [Pseudogymnoascus sp. VKM F-4514 (FW-929)]|nr:hypothetical protein V495_05563 [Pseudogymnoascus sp. VKM F-4514 (FW-929)]KFY55083.1 hypothetical protein V497_07198 [Pseudogymnoascus sp. VKM F-4516 (FW-969)]
MTTFNIEIVSDVVCPWCYIGYRRLQKAINMYRKTYPDGSKDIFNITWKPYYLNEDPPATPVDRWERMVARMGPVRAPEIAARLKAIAGGEGILMADNGVVGGTELCHVLLHLAGKISLEQQNKVAEELFRAYFEEAKDIFNAPSLVEAGVAAGMERGSLEKGLKDDKALEEVRKEERENKARRGRGVPRFYMGGITIEGAKDMEDFFEAFLQIKEGRVEQP